MTTPPVQPPGWYPDPWGEGAQRYFDGLNWGPAAPAPEPPPLLSPPNTNPPTKPSRRTALLAVAGAVGLLVLVSTCEDEDKKSDSRASESATSTTEVAEESTPIPSPTPTGPARPDANFTVIEGPGGQEVTATFAIGDNFTEGMIKAGARYETINILEYADVTYPDAVQVTVVGSFPMQDAYGNTSTDEVVNVTYLRSTLDKINFARVDKDKIWELRDSGFIAPAFRP